MDWFDELTLDPEAHPVAMGIRSLGDRPWLVVDDNLERDLELKADLLATRGDQVLHTTDDSRAAATVLVDLVGAAPTNDAMHPIEQAARATQEDLCLLRRHDDGWHLDASCLCFPTRWHLRDKVGHHIAAIHGPVDGYDPRITDRVDRLFDQLTDRPVWRRNWFLMTDPTLFQPDRPASETVIEADRVLDQLFIRSERQTLRQLLPGWIVFTIRIQQQPLRSLLTSPDRMQAFVDWTNSVSDEFGARRHLGPAQRHEILRSLAT